MSRAKAKIATVMRWMEESMRAGEITIDQVKGWSQMLASARGDIDAAEPVLVTAPPVVMAGVDRLDMAYAETMLKESTGALHRLGLMALAGSGKDNRGYVNHDVSTIVETLEALAIGVARPDLQPQKEAGV